MNLHQMILDSTSKPPTKAFIIAGDGNKAAVCDTAIIVNCVRHGRETGLMYLDAWTAPTSMLDVYGMKPKDQEVLRIYPTQDTEKAIWKKILPAAAESCRRSWEHKPSCEYLGKRRIPLSIEDWGNPLCKCGCGADVDDFPKDSWLAYLKEKATRIALPTLSAVSYVEPMDPTGSGS